MKATLACCTLALAAAQTLAAPSCQTTAAAMPPTVVELYTSEGCSSCPPADRWLSSLQGRGDVLTLAFHVNYWDQLGWTDRYATPETTARQWALAHAGGSAQVYTPQVVVNGRDGQAGARLPQPSAASPVALTLVRDGDAVTAQVTAAAGAPQRLEGYWAVLEDGHESKVRAGENAGATLRHDSVVRLYKPVPGWAAAAGASSRLAGVAAGDAAHPRRVVFVVSDPATRRPVQAAALAC